MSDETPNLDPTHDSSAKRQDQEDTVMASQSASRPARVPGLPGEIGGYRIIGLLGEGGMGVVYEAEQPSPRRLVALKVVRGTELVDDLRLKMFEHEATTLARLDHPNIGRIYESGRTEEGRHFFAMELVRGPILSSWLAGRPQNPDREEINLRLQLFRQICDAVHYAHQRGVIHRDLKPSNLIVTESRPSGSSSDQSPAVMVKILDFGLARITEEDVAATQVTEIGVIKGTLPYMAPEQARGEVDAIDVRTDVYALGVILYELLTNQRPYSVDTGSLLSAVHVICEQAPRPLAEVWKSPTRLDPDLATITSTALEKDAHRRYASAAAFGEDIGRFLSSQPIQARPPSTMYQLKKLVARRKALFATAAAALVLLVVAAIAMAVLYVRSEANLARALEAEQVARREAETAERTSAFMVKLFQSSDPQLTRGATVTAREVIDEGAKRIATELANEPVMQARLMYTIGQVYVSLGLLEQALEMAEQSLAIRRKQLPSGDIDLAASLHLLGRVYDDQGKSEEARKAFTEALALYEALGAKGTDGVVDVLGNYAWMLGDLGELRRADSMITRALELIAAKQPPDQERLVKLLNNQASIKMNMGQADTAVQILARALPLTSEYYGDTSGSIANVLTNFGVAYSMLGQFDKASGYANRALIVYRAIYGEVHPMVIKALGNLGVYLAQAGKLGEARPYMEESVAALKKLYVTDHPEIATGYSNLGYLKFQMADFNGAVADLDIAVTMQEKTSGPESMAFALSLFNLANAHAARGELALARRQLLRVISIDEKIFGPEAQEIVEDLGALVEVVRKMGRESEVKAAEERINMINEKFKAAAATTESADSTGGGI